MRTSLGLRVARVHLGHARRPAVTASAAAPLPCARIRPATPSPILARSSTRAAPTASQTKPPTPTQTQPEIVSSPTSRPTSPLPPSATLNPPASTRPPRLELPTRAPGSALITHLFHLGRAYTAFYKAGLGAIFANRRLLLSSTSAPPSRADVLLRERVRHDLSRLPAFGLLVLVCAELTPLVVLAVPRLTPLTCRIPRQADAIRRSAAARRAASFRALRAGHPPDEAALRRLAPGHVCRSLGLSSALWDVAGFDSPFAAGLARRAIARVAADDAMIRDGGGVEPLVDEEVALACDERGIDVLGESPDRLRSRLEDWLSKTVPSSDGDGDAAAKTSGQKEAEEKIEAMLLGLDNE
ncbi:hypothetical protein GGR52DRAFT_528024 [Hypoxylon sp. FL1284]|nr:hypothetical protein GGR52DRAFT_528024 [Hypoxylon sp. FL1284]